MPWYGNYFPPSWPIAAKGGIRSRSKRGAFAKSWWARRWLDVLEALNLGGRLQRGRSYARSGQVLDITIEPGTVRASVQGARPKPYAVTIGIRKLVAKDTALLAAELGRNPYCLAKLIAREMPRDIESVFDTARVSLFPARASELHTDCSCPDWSNPCKHIAAVYYLLGEEFDRDPFLLFKLRGMSREELVEKLGAATPAAQTEAIEEASPALPPEPLTADAATFWQGGALPDDLFGEVRQP